MSFSSWLRYLKLTGSFGGGAGGVRPGRNSRRGNSAAVRLPRKPGAFVRLELEPLEQRQLPSVITVNTTADDADGNTSSPAALLANPGPDQTISLREAILACDNDGSAGTDYINFAIGFGMQTIAPLSGLPVITRPMILDATSQPGFFGLPVIELNGSSIPAGAPTSHSGLAITANGCTVKGFLIDHFTYDGIYLQGANNNVIGAAQPAFGAMNIIEANGRYGVEMTVQSTGNLVNANFIGTDPSGTSGLGNSQGGVTISDDSSGNHIGLPNTLSQQGSGPFDGAGNVISGNDGNGVVIEDPGTTGNFVQGNFIGTHPFGNKPLPNTASGVLIYNAASGNVIGGSSFVNNPLGGFQFLAGAGNLISGNSAAGVEIFEATGNSVQGNFIGTDLSGTQKVPNAAAANFDGVDLLKGASDNQIGGPSSIDGTGRLMGLGNLISGNHLDGVAIGDFFGGPGPAQILEARNHVEGNFIGTDVTGTIALANGENGVHLDGDAVGNFIGGTAPGTRNVISGNGVAGSTPPLQLGAGVQIADFFGSGPDENNVVQNNYIGMDVTGVHALGNLSEGVMIQRGAANNHIGAAGAGNLISGNPNAVVITDSTTTGNKLLANTIGLGADGQPILPGAGDGNLIEVRGGANYNQLGQAGAGNIISGATQFGIVLSDPGTNNNNVQGNYIGTDATGEQPRPNQGAGIVIQNGAANNLIGGAGQGNVISGNGTGSALTSLGFTGGVIITDQNTTGNILEDNLIGTDASGTMALGNVAAGVLIRAGANGNLIRRAQTGNVISGNAPATTAYGFGVYITDFGTTNNLVTGNFIGTDVTGTEALGVQVDGVAIANGASFNQIGAAGKPNVISGNTHAGVDIDGQNTKDDRILGNLIGTDVTGTLPLGNGNPTQASPDDGLGVFVGRGPDSIFVGIGIPGGGNVISGNVRGVEVASDSGNIYIVGNYIGTDITGTKALGNGTGVTLMGMGSATIVGPGNVISGNSTGVFFERGGGLVVGNLIGTDASGEHMLGNIHYGIVAMGNPAAPTTVQLGSPGGVLGGNVVAGNRGGGIKLEGPFTAATVVANLIGTDAAGTTAFPNTGYGIDLENTSNVTVGGTAAGSANVIAANTLGGVFVNGSTPTSTSPVTNVIAGNSIGTDLHDTIPLGNGGDGIVINNSSGNTIGGTVAGAGNIIAYNAQGGVDVATGTGNAIRGNSIFANGSFVNAGIPHGPGIVLGSGANNNAPAPILTTATYSTGKLLVFGLAKPGDVVDLFANAADDPEGKIYLGSKKTLPVRQIGAVSLFSVSLQTTLALDNKVITATQTDANGNTSAFSFPIIDPPSHDNAGPFVYQLYEDLLGRPPSYGEFNYWTGRMHQGMTARQVAAAIMRGLEYRTIEVQTAYHTYLQRDAGAAELAAATHILSNGGTVEQLQVRLVTSPEYWQLQGGTAAGFLNGLYQEALGHAPDAAEVAALTPVLHPGRVAEAVFASAEYRRDLIENDYMALLYHAPDKRAERAFLQALAHGARDEDVLAAIFGSAGYLEGL
jgi:hypothetical protein